MKKFAPLFFILFAAITGGGTSALAKIASVEIPPITFTLLRFLLAGLTLLPLFLIFNIKINKQDYKKIIGISLISAMNPFLFSIGIKHTTAMMGQMIYTVLPLVTVVFSYILGQEIITKRKVIGITIGLIGAMIIILQPGLGKSIQINGSILGNLAIFAGAISFAIYTILIKPFQKSHSPLELNMYFFAVSFAIQLLLLPIDLSMGPAWWNTITLGGVLGVLYVGIIGTGIYYILLQYALKTSSPLATSTTLYLQPLFAIVWASALLNEKITSTLFIGGILAFIGIGIIMHKQKIQQAI